MIGWKKKKKEIIMMFLMVKIRELEKKSSRNRSGVILMRRKHWRICLKAMKMTKMIEMLRRRLKERLNLLT